MTGRDLIIYILENNLEDEPIFNDGKPMGFMTTEETATKFDVGIATVFVWMFRGQLDYVKIGHTYFVPADCSLAPEGTFNT